MLYAPLELFNCIICQTNSFFFLFFFFLRGRPMTVHFVLFLVSVKRRGLPRVTTGCCVFFPCYRYFTLVQYRSNLFFFFTFGCHTLPLTQPWNTIPLCHLYKLVKSFLWVSVTCSRKCCCCFRYVQYVIRHTGFHTPNGDCEQSVSHRNPCGKLFTQGMNFEDLASYSAFLLYVFCVGKWLCSEKLLPSSAFFF